jgi:hypothetical protein
MCVWCGGVPLGDLNERYCGLFHAYSELTWLADNLQGLWAQELDGLDDVAAWNFLDGLLFGHHGDVPVADDRSIEECQRDSKRWGCFSFLTNWGEQFDGYKSFILCPPGEYARILSRSVTPPSVSGFSITRTGFKLATAGFAKWFELESLRLGIPAIQTNEKR